MFFKNREFAVRLLKADKRKDSKETAEETDVVDERVAQYAHAAKMFVYHAAVGVCAYVVLDTYKQVQVSKNTPIQPR